MSDSDLEALSQPKPDSHVKDVKIQSKQPKPPAKSEPVKPLIPQVAETRTSYEVDSYLDGMPPPPDNFPDGWDSEWQPSFEDVAVASQPEPKFEKKEEVTPPRVQLETAPAEVDDVEVTQDEVKREAIVTSIYIPLAKEEKDKDHPPKQITVNLRSSGNKEPPSLPKSGPRP
jgi:hypothetical protein